MAKNVFVKYDPNDLFQPERWHWPWSCPPRLQHPPLLPSFSRRSFSSAMSTDTDDETGSGIGGNGHALSRLSSNEEGESVSSSGSMSTVLITANVGSIFEEPDQLIPKWHGEITQYLEANKPKFVALHFQEVGHFTEVIRVKTEIRREKNVRPQNICRVYMNNTYCERNSFRLCFLCTSMCFVICVQA